MPDKTQTVEPHDYDLEEVYDDKIAPLMTRIIKICQDEGMPMVASFCYRSSEDEDDYCTTAIPVEGRTPDKFEKARKMLYDMERPFALGIMITKKKKGEDDAG